MIDPSSISQIVNHQHHQPSSTSDPRPAKPGETVRPLGPCFCAAPAIPYRRPPSSSVSAIGLSVYQHQVEVPFNGKESFSITDYKSPSVAATSSYTVEARDPVNQPVGLRGPHSSFRPSLWTCVPCYFLRTTQTFFYFFFFSSSSSAAVPTIITSLSHLISRPGRSSPRHDLLAPAPVPRDVVAGKRRPLPPPS